MRRGAETISNQEILDAVSKIETQNDVNSRFHVESNHTKRNLLQQLFANLRIAAHHECAMKTVGTERARSSRQGTQKKLKLEEEKERQKKILQQELGIDEEVIERCQQTQNRFVQDILLKKQTQNSNIKDELSAFTRKAGVAAAGGTLILTGIPMVPLPGPGARMILGGFVLLAKEFPEAQRVLDDTRDQLTGLLDKLEDDITESPNTKNAKMEGINETSKDFRQQLQDTGRAFRKQIERVGRHVLLPALENVCTPRDTECGTVITDTESSSVVSDDETTPLTCDDFFAELPTVVEVEAL